MEKLVGDKRTFSNDTRVYKIREIIEDPKISMNWTWDSGLCPHCKERITRTIKHDFYRIEILGDDIKVDKDLTKSDITIMGDTLDNRRMILTIDKYDEVFDKSTNFKNLKGV